ncbi:MAG TPA: hypothetical protein PK250_16045 [Syntrophobacter fumaroxidans]|nr:hypothetical protein [Syntrophobacter fumaroxidans]
MQYMSAGNPLQRRLKSFGLNMMVMAVSFGLYYLGFFGGVEGPLNMTNIGKTIVGLGFTSNHFQVLLFAFFIIALTWNWVLNLVAHLTGQRLTCSAGSEEKGFCGQPVQRSRDSEGKGWIYTCPCNHRGAQAHFRPIRKGTKANSVLMVSLVCCVMYYVS